MRYLRHMNSSITNGGAEYEKQDAYNIERKNGEKKAQCDKIEELRASIQ